MSARSAARALQLAARQAAPKAARSYSLLAARRSLPKAPAVRLSALFSFFSRLRFRRNTVQH